MSKILNIGDGYSIKINKNNIQPQITVVSKNSYSETSLTFTLTQRTKNTLVLILCENNYGQSSIRTIGVHDKLIYDAVTTIGTGNTYTVDRENRIVTVSCTPYTTITLVDFAGNTWE